MVPDCAFVLGNGRQCRGPALQGQRYCRHHVPGVARPRSSRGSRTPSPDPTSDPRAWKYQVAAYWRSLHAAIAAAADDADIDELYGCIISGLTRHEISHRSAGRLFAALLDRHARLRSDAQTAALLALGEQCRQSLGPL